MATNWGNYTDYSGPSKLPGSATHVLDPRLNLLAALIPGLFAAKSCLDIGCNAGSVSCQLAFDFHAAAVHGVDIDPKLAAQAEKLLALRASRLRPPTNDSEHVVDYFPMSAVLTHGYRIEPESEASRSSSSASALSNWPRVKFFSADWVVATNQSISGPYDVILALSVIKWIHLEHLDQGLRIFFHKCSSSLKPDGYLIIELQTWDSYEKAVRPSKGPHFNSNLHLLKYRPETSFDDLLAEEGLYLCASSTALPRRISVYRKKVIS
ncbi:S-adenosyl-L-methionine-dependent methyltransferase [Cucurbitaria berberidis CBS 394.84]|uniref:RNA methyltransferase n=1 Tax=Cucurbitaria berberidis CBS 394.84 TaxID=1168544 RepID=A0A9P4GL41_9PLEO|nr:S-adenosyl-L-methionine-dependent methyltransferase [Cucurbitaria berberidis CBS 394.84]KAF1847590.1 S-adenosyl-L-methionine-dependent methyltransferase [Cucurbitaria berberidis CBS 394.84]